MPAVDPAVIADASRVAAAAWANQVMPRLAIPLDGVAGLLARLLGTPTAAVSVVSDVYDDCVGAYGLPPPLTRHVPIEYSVCKYVVSAGRPTAVGNMRIDPELRGHPALLEFGVAAFAGAPLCDTEGRPVGALTVVDFVPREWTVEHMEILVEVAALLGPVPAGPGRRALGMLEDARTATRPHRQPNSTVQAEVQHRFITTLLDSLQVGVLAVDPEGEPVLINRALRQLCGIDESVAVHEAADIAYRRQRRPTGRFKDIEETVLHRALAGQSVRDAKVLLHEPGLPERVLLINGEPIRAADGQLLGAVSTLMDVTQARRAEQFRAAELDVATLLNKAHTLEDVAPAVVGRIGRLLPRSCVALWLVDQWTGMLRPVTAWTAPGVTAGDFLRDHLNGDDLNGDDAGPGRRWAAGEALHIPELATSPDHTVGSARAFAQECLARGMHTMIVLPIRESDDVVGVLSCLCAAESGEAPHLGGLVSGTAAQIGAFLARRRAADLATQLSRAKDDFISLVGHAVRTPLTSIGAFAELVYEIPDLPEEARGLLHGVVRNAEALRRIVTDLLDAGALETGENALDLVHLDLATIIDAAVRAARPMAQAGGTDLVLLPTPNLHVYADPHRLRQMLDNLLSNAIKFTPGGRVEVRAHRDRNTIEVCVADNGIGIPPDQRDRVFDRFFRADNVAHGTATGSGLGLTLVRTIVDAHGGSTHLAGQDGPGTTVVVRLPASRTVPATALPATDTPATALPATDAPVPAVPATAAPATPGGG